MPLLATVAFNFNLQRVCISFYNECISFYTASLEQNCVIRCFLLATATPTTPRQNLQQENTEHQASSIREAAAASKTETARSALETTNAELVNKLTAQSLALLDANTRITTLQNDLSRAQAAAAAPDFSEAATRDMMSDVDRAALESDLQGFKEK